MSQIVSPVPRLFPNSVIFSRKTCMLSPVINSSMVVFPEPFGPRINQCSPGRTFQFKSTRTLCSSQPTFTSSNFIRLSGKGCALISSLITPDSSWIFRRFAKNVSRSILRRASSSRFFSLRIFSYSLRSPQKEIFLSLNSNTRLMLSGIS